MTASDIIGQYVDVDGVKTYFESAGTGPTIICLHTSGRDCRQWHRYLQYFGERYRVVALDMPGHQKSWPLPGNKCIADAHEYAEFIWSFADSIGAEHPVVIGCSVGGNIVFLLAQLRPTGIAALVSMQGSAYSPPASPQILLTHPQIQLGQYLADRAVGLCGSRSPQDVRDFVEWNALQATPDSQYGDLAVYGNFDVRDGMRDITCPCLLIRGTDDWIVTDEMVETTARALKRAKTVKIERLEGIGHFSHMEAPDECIKIIEDFLSAAVPQ